MSDSTDKQEVRFDPAECVPDCKDPFCPYSHNSVWFCGDKPYPSKEEAEAALRKSEQE